MSIIKGRFALLAAACCFLLCVTYLLSNKRYQHLRRNLHNTPLKINNKVISRSYEKFVIRSQRMVNDVGEVLADEQPDFNEIRLLSIQQRNVVNLKNKRRFVGDLTSNTLPPNAKEPGPRTNKSSYRHPIVGLIEGDAKIDDNLLPISYKYYINNNKLSDPTCTSESPVNHVVSLFIHQTGIQTINNIFYRYGDFSNLYFALPKPWVFKYYWPLRFHSSYVDKTLLDKAPPNFLLNGARYNKESLQSLASKNAVYLAMLRNPIDHFQSIYNLAGVPYFMKMIHNATTDLFKEFTHNPLENIQQILNRTNKFQPAFHLLKNPQLFDLGYELNDYKNPKDMSFILSKLDEQLDFVLIYEYLDESLVILQRLLCWELEDMIHIKSNVLPSYYDKIPKEIKKNILAWNHEDSLLYSHFNKTFWKRIKQQEDQLFWEDVSKLKELSKETGEECFQKNKNFSRKSTQHLNRMMDKSVKNRLNQNTLGNSEPFESYASNLHTDTDDSIKDNLTYLCERLLLSEKDYVMLLKLKQKQKLKDQYEAILNESFITNGTNGKFLYALKFIEQERQQYLNQSNSDSSEKNQSEPSLNNQSIDENSNEIEDEENISEVSILKL